LIEKAINDIEKYSLKIINCDWWRKRLFVKDQWHLLKEVNLIKHNHIEALAHVPTGSPWFSGHFPGAPILPGVALIHIVEQAIEKEAQEKGQKIQLDALKRVRFTQPVRPGETLSLHITSENTGEKTLFSFKVDNKENVVCTGMLVAKRVKKVKKEEIGRASCRERVFLRV
jgi:3-hydroxyacyl-[acyl-carrier-protein] dehydratase